MFFCVYLTLLAKQRGKKCHSVTYEINVRGYQIKSGKLKLFWTFYIFDFFFIPKAFYHFLTQIMVLHKKLHWPLHPPSSSFIGLGSSLIHSESTFTSLSGTRSTCNDWFKVSYLRAPGWLRNLASAFRSGHDSWSPGIKFCIRLPEGSLFLLCLFSASLSLCLSWINK